MGMVSSVFTEYVWLVAYPRDDAQSDVVGKATLKMSLTREECLPKQLQELMTLIVPSPQKMTVTERKTLWANLRSLPPRERNP